MPLILSSRDEDRESNIKRLISEGKPEKQAVAIAYSIQRRALGEAEPEEVAKGILTMASGEFAEEHKRLIRVLRSPSHKDDAEEARRQEAEVREEIPGDAEEVIGKADTGPAEEENQVIRRNMKTPEAHGRHEFRRAKWTAGNGHPRCLLCGDEEPQGGMCMGIHGAVPVNGDTLAKADRGPHRMLTEHEVRQRAHEKEPTEAQLRAGNYPKTHWNMHGMRIAIENLAGSKRRGVDHKGEPWEVTMPYHYGYIKGTEGADGDHLDVAVGPLMDQGTEAHIINQRGPGGEFDEHKVFIGYPSREAAIHAFRAGRSDDPDDVMGAVVTVPIDELKRWIDEGCLQEEAILKAETSHVKAHYRIQNGRVVYIPNYDRAVHGDHPEATLHQRTVLGTNTAGRHFIRATDAADREKVLGAAQTLGIHPEGQRPSGANHHGRQNSYPTIFFHTYEQAHQVMDAVRALHGDLAHEHTVQRPSRGAGALQDGIARMNAQRQETREAQAAQAPSAPARIITPAQVAANEEPPEAELARRLGTAGANAARNRFFGFHNAGILDRRVYLENTTPGHNKRYIIDLRQVGEGQWVVNAGNGRRDSASLTVRTKTERPMSQAAANALVSQIKAEKIGGGYVVKEDDATPRVQVAWMDNFSHPLVNVADPLAGEQPHTPGVSVQTPARPAPVAAPAAPSASAAPTPAPAAPARQAPAPTQAAYNALRQAAWDMGNLARNTESSNTPEAFLASMKAAQAHEAAVPVARSLGIAEGSDRGPVWHSNRAQHWLSKAKTQWTGAVTPALARSGSHSAVANGQGFADAVRAIEGSQNIMAQRPAGAALPAGVTEADYTRMVTNQAATLKALKIGQELEAEVRPGAAPGTQAVGMTSTIMDRITRGTIPHEHAPQARRIAESMQNLMNASNAARDMAADPAAEPDTLKAVAQTVATMHTAANIAMNAAHEDVLWRKAPKRVIDELAKFGEKAAREASRREAMPRKSDARYAAGHEQHMERAAQAHSEAVGTNVQRPKLIQALDAHKQAAVSVYHAALAAPKGSRERAHLMTKAQEHAQHARDFVAKLNRR